MTAAVSQIVPPQTWRRSPLWLLTVVYLYFAIRRLYGERTWTAIWKAFVMRLGLFATEFAAIGVALAAAIAMVNSH